MAGFGVSRRRPAVRADGMPGWLAEYRPELWAADLEDPLEVYYFGRCRWTAARTEWHQGGDPQPKIQSPRPVQRESVNTSAMAGDRLGVSLPTLSDLRKES